MEPRETLKFFATPRKTSEMIEYLKKYIPIEKLNKMNYNVLWQFFITANKSSEGYFKVFWQKIDFIVDKTNMSYEEIFHFNAINYLDNILLEAIGVDIFTYSNEVQRLLLAKEKEELEKGNLGYKKVDNYQKLINANAVIPQKFLQKKELTEVDELLQNIEKLRNEAQEIQYLIDSSKSSAEKSDYESELASINWSLGSMERKLSELRGNHR